ncbi:MAG: FAD:protein FMN transferase [Actinomycetes bacterium]
MVTLSRQVESWGTVILFELSSQQVSEDKLIQAFSEAEKFIHHVDELFSTYKENSTISRLKRDEIEISSCSPEVQEVWDLCEKTMELTDGAFNPWLKGFDPSGLVKGWAAQKCGEIFEKYGVENSLVNAAGDLALRGGLLKDGALTPWEIGIRNPEIKDEIVESFKINTGAIATSGSYEKGAHIYDPFTNLIAIGARSATVIGPDAAIADALATALVVSGKDGAIWFSKPELKSYSVFVIERNSDQSWSITSSS